MSVSDWLQVHKLSDEELKQREVIVIDIANDYVKPSVRHPQFHMLHSFKRFS